MDHGDVGLGLVGRAVGLCCSSVRMWDQFSSPGTSLLSVGIQPYPSLQCDCGLILCRRQNSAKPPSGIAPALTTHSQVPASQGRGGLWSWAAAGRIAACVSSGRTELSRSFLGLGILWQTATATACVGGSCWVSTCCNLGSCKHKALVLQSMSRSRSTHASSIGAGCCTQRASILPPALSKGQPRSSGSKPHALLSSPQSHNIQMSPNHLC